MAGATLATSAGAQVSGTVRDATSLEPIVGARVSVQASNLEAQTDATGAFTIPGATGAVVVVGAARSYFNGSVPAMAPASGLDIALDRVPTEEDPNAPFIAAAGCVLCHIGVYAEWFSSPMSKSGGNTWVYDLYDGSGTAGGLGGFVYQRDSTLATDDPESECAACHEPERWVLSPGSGLDALGDQTAESLHGVSCEICHKIADIDETKPNYPGIWPGVVSLKRPAGYEVMYGVLGDVDYVMGWGARASYQPQLGAAVCAACHQDKNDPDRDGDFEEDDGVVSEPTYLEWRDSPYADPASPVHATCVDCHMRPTGAPRACNKVDYTRPRGDIRSHELDGTSARFLEHAAELELHAALVDDRVEVEATVVNSETGHHLPTGVTTRNVILLVEAVRSGSGEALEFVDGDIVDELGGVAPEGGADRARGYYGGLPGKLYGKVARSADSPGPVFFTEATGVRFDTRIAALGSDPTHYVFAAPRGGGRVQVTARLIYRRAWRALVDAKGWTEDGHGRPLADMAPPHFGALMERAEASVETPPECTTSATCGVRGDCIDGACVHRTSFDVGGGCVLAPRAPARPDEPARGLTWLAAAAVWLGRRRRRRA